MCRGAAAAVSMGGQGPFHLLTGGAGMRRRTQSRAGGGARLRPETHPVKSPGSDGVLKQPRECSGRDQAQRHSAPGQHSAHAGLSGLSGLCRFQSPGAQPDLAEEGGAVLGWARRRGGPATPLSSAGSGRRAAEWPQSSPLPRRCRPGLTQTLLGADCAAWVGGRLARGRARAGRMRACPLCAWREGWRAAARMRRRGGRVSTLPRRGLAHPAAVSGRGRRRGPRDPGRAGAFTEEGPGAGLRQQSAVREQEFRPARGSRGSNFLPRGGVRGTAAVTGGGRGTAGRRACVWGHEWCLRSGRGR